MIRSMTAYASRSSSLPTGVLSWELKSVNQRYLDLSIRLPEEFRMLEPEVRECLRAVLARGRIEAGLRFQPDPAAVATRLELNRPLAKTLLGMHGDLAKIAGRDEASNLFHLLQWPGLVVERRSDLEPERKAALGLLEQTLGDLVSAREQEGHALESMLRTRLDGVAKLVARVRMLQPGIREGLRIRFEERLAALEQPVDPGRLEQELVLQLSKLDVDEELDRLDTHVEELRRVLDLDEPLGRRLDFLLQELNREANTLGSKAAVVDTSLATVELKVLIEQMREQVQNVE